MAYIDTDVIVHIHHTFKDTRTGQSSQYADTPHPGTNKTVDGWKWDERTWPDEGESRAAAVAPSIWDASVSGLDDQYLEAGIGDHLDLLYMATIRTFLDGKDVWAPEINHGFFYSHGSEWYLFSDSFQTQYLTVTGVEDGNQVVSLNYQYKPTIPIEVRSFFYDHLEGYYKVYRDYRKVVEFSDDPDGPEFKLDTTANLPKVIVNGTQQQNIGIPITLSVSGTSPVEDTLRLDLFGVAHGGDNQQFLLNYSPVDKTQPIQVWGWAKPDLPKEWTVIDLEDSFTSGVREVKVDYDLGRLIFGDVDWSIVPPAGWQMGASYTLGVAVMYEPEDSIDSIVAFNEEADLNPVMAATSRGFVQITVDSPDPATVALSSNMIFNSGAYQIEVGNNVGRLYATVRNRGGDTLEGENVVFEIQDPTIGSLGSLNQTSKSAVTQSNGRASVLYNTPFIVESLGQGTITVSHDSGNTIIEVEGLVEPQSVDSLYIYKVHESDDVLGISVNDLTTYYEDYLTDQSILTDGQQGTVGFEQTYRLLHELGRPTTYTATDYVTGKKTILLTQSKTDVMDPHTGSITANKYAPLAPTSYENIGDDDAPILRVVYENIELDLPGTNGVKSYFLAGDARTIIKAYVLDERTGNKIYSNAINVSVSLADTMNGTYFCSLLSDIPSGLLTRVQNVDNIPEASITDSVVSGYLNDEYQDERLWYGNVGGYETFVDWFRRTKRGDTLILEDLYDLTGDSAFSGLELVNPLDCPAEIPLGFRLKSGDITIASLLDQITYLDPNDHLPSGYHDV